MSETILVTGSTGFIGARLLQYLAAEGVRVRIFLRVESRAGVLPDGVEVVRGSFSDPESLAQAVKGIDRLVHLAGVTKAVDESGYDTGNVMPVKNLFAAIMKHNPELRRFIYISSLTAGGPASDGIRGVKESDPPHPVSAYGRSKLRAEILCQEYAQHIPVTVVRPPAVYGPGDKDVLQVFLMLARGVLVLPGSAETQRFSMIYVDDLVEGIMMAARSLQAVGQIYYITSPGSLSWDDVVAAAKPALGFSKIFKFILPQPFVFLLGTVVGTAGSLFGKPALISRDKAYELVQNYWVCSPELARQDFGFAAQTTLSDGIARTIDWYRQKGWL